MTALFHICFGLVRTDIEFALKCKFLVKFSLQCHRYAVKSGHEHAFHDWKVRNGNEVLSM
jgi:hypothetical protein